MMCVSEFSFDKYIMLDILSTNEPFPLRKDGPRVFPPSNPQVKCASGPVEAARGFRRLGGLGAELAKFPHSDNLVSQDLSSAT
jgi:hypothetical protein